MSVNVVAVTGNLTRDAELRTTQNGNAILRGGVAVNERRKNNEGNWEDYANFVDFVIWGRRAESLAQYLTKGTKVAIKGRLHYSSWQADDGSKRSKLEVVVDDIDLMSRGNQGAPNAQQGGQPNNYHQRQQNGYQGGYNAPQQGYQPQQAAYADEDIPF